MDIAKNFSKATVSDGNYDASATSIDLTTGGGDRMPVAPFNLVWWNATDFPDPSDDPSVEIVRVTDVTDDTLTIVRGQEGTAAADHNLAGKTYKVIACLTAKAVNEDIVGDVFGSGVAIIVLVPDDSINIRGANGQAVALGPSGIQIQSLSVVLGDNEGTQNSTTVFVDDGNQLIALSGKIGTNQSASASIAVGTLAAKMPIYDAGGTLLGYVPIYNSIT